MGTQFAITRKKIAPEKKKFASLISREKKSAYIFNVKQPNGNFQH